MGRRARIGWDSHSLVAAALIGVCGHAHPLTAQNAAAPADSTALVEGRVIRADRSLVRGATVGVLGAGDSTTTSDSGRFVLRNITPGAHMLWVRGLGFERTRVTVTLTAGRPRSLTVTVAEAVPVLAPVVTSGHVPPGYADVGLDKRMQAGIGQFLTFDQIQQRQATRVSQLLAQMRGIYVWKPPKSYDYVVEGTRGVGSCVGYVVDGVPQTQLPPTPEHPGRSADEFMDPSAIGAIEVYGSSERPAEFGPGLAERSPSVSGGGFPAIDVKAQRCVLVVIWSRARLGLTEADAVPPGMVAPTTPARAAAPRAAITRGVAALPASDGRECQALAPTDTTTLNVYAILQSGLGLDAQDTAWISYANRVFAAFRQSFALPSPLQLPVFGYGSPALSKRNWKSPGFAVAPTLSTVVAFTLAPTGALLSSSVSVSSLSGEADTSILAAVATAAATHAFPFMPTGSLSINFDVIVTTTVPDSTQHAVVVDQIAVPEWQLTRAAAMASGAQPAFASGRASAARSPDSVRFEFVVDETGRAVMSTGRAIGVARRVADPTYLGFLARIAQALPSYRFDPALVGTCPVPQVTSQLFTD